MEPDLQSPCEVDVWHALNATKSVYILYQVADFIRKESSQTWILKRFSIINTLQIKEYIQSLVSNEVAQTASTLDQNFYQNELSNHASFQSERPSVLHTLFGERNLKQ